MSTRMPLYTPRDSSVGFGKSCDDASASEAARAAWKRAASVAERVRSSSSSVTLSMRIVWLSDTYA